MRVAALLFAIVGLCVHSAAPRASVSEAQLRSVEQALERGEADAPKTLNALVAALTADTNALVLIDSIAAFAVHGMFEEASSRTVSSVEAAHRLALAIGDSVRAAYLDGILLSLAHISNPDLLARSRMQVALNALRAAGANERLVVLLNIHTRHLGVREEFPAAVRLNNEALNILNGRPLSAASYYARYGRAELLTRIGEPERALAVLEKLVEEARALDRRAWTLAPQFLLCRTNAILGERAVAARCFEAFYSEIHETESATYRLAVIMERLLLALEGDELSVLRVWTERGETALAEVNSAGRRARFGAIAARALARQGAGAEAQSRLARALTEPFDRNAPGMRASIAQARAEVASASLAPAATQAWRAALQHTTEALRSQQRAMVKAQADLYQISEREAQQARLAQQAELHRLERESAESRYATQRLVAILTVVLAVLGVAVAVWALRRARAFRVHADVDALTGVASRSAIDRAAQTAFGREGGPPLSLLMIDVDGLKATNDRFGHARGDALLTRFAALVASNLRPQDQIGRYGGDEFLVLLPDADPKDAHAIAERLRGALNDGLAHGGFINVSASLGAATRADNESFKSTRERADQALYRAKRSGKDRVEDAD